MALCATLTLAGCDLTWEKPEAAAPPPERFRAAAPKSAPSLHSTHEFVERFRSPELTRVIDEALAGNNDIAAAVARITQADAQARVSSAPLFPSLSNVNNFERFQTPSTVYGGVGATGGQAAAAAASSSPYSATQSNYFSLGLNASYTLDIWGVNQDASAASRLLANASRFNRKVVEIATVASALNAYFAVLNAQDQLRIVNENVRIAGHVLTALRARREVGLATVLDVAQQEQCTTPSSR